MDKSKNKRKPNYSESESLVFLKILENNKEALAYDSELYGEELANVWENIAVEFSSQTITPRTGPELRTKFKDLKSRTKKKIAEIKTDQNKTGGRAPKKLTEVEKLVQQLAGENAMAGFSYYADTFSEEPIVIVEDDVNIEKDKNKRNTKSTYSKTNDVGTFKKIKKRKEEINNNKNESQEVIRILTEQVDVSKKILNVLTELKDFIKGDKRCDNNETVEESYTSNRYIEEEYLLPEYQKD